MSEKDSLRKLIMLISELRAKDEERYEAHVNFMNETIKMITAIESQMNKHWSTVLDTLKELNVSISTNLDSLLTGINPKGLRETSSSLKEIMDTMNQSVQSMNLEKVLSELKVLQSGGGFVMMPAQGQSNVVAQGQQVQQISTGLKAPGNAPPGLKAPGGAAAADQTPDNYVFGGSQNEDDDDDEASLLKPSDFFGM